MQETADQCYELLKADPSHPSLHFKKLGKKGVAESRYEPLTESFEDPLRISQNHSAIQQRRKKYWSVRAGLDYRALGVEVEGGISWFWIGTHAEYDKLIGKL